MFERRKVVIAGCSETLWLPPPSSFHHLFDTVHTRRLKLCKTSFCQIHLPPGIRPRVLREEDRSSLRYEEKGEKRGREGGEGNFGPVLRFLRLEYTTVVTYILAL